MRKAGEKENRFWFYFGLAILAATWGCFILGFLSLISVGVILLPLIALIYGAPLIGLQYVVWERPLLAIVALFFIGLLAVGLWRESERKTEPYWRLVRNSPDGDMEFRLVEPGCPESEMEPAPYWLLWVRASGAREVHLIKTAEEHSSQSYRRSTSRERTR